MSSFPSAASDPDDQQSSLSEWQIGGGFLKGKTVKHSPLLTSMIEGLATGAEIFVSKQTTGAHRWNHFFNYPSYGICYTFLDLGCPTHIGNAQCLYPYMNFHLFNNNNRINLHLRTGIGLAYVQKVYDKINNPKNEVFGTNVNGLISIQLQGSYQMNKKWSFLAGAGITHISNAGWKMPNSGANVVSFYSGISHAFGKEKNLIMPESKINEKNKKWACTLHLSTGIKEIRPIGGEKYITTEMNVQLTKKHLPYTRFGVSFDVVYDASDYYCIIFQALPATNDLNLIKTGISGGYILLFGDCSVNFFVGTYIHAENTLHGRLYIKSSFNYPLSDRWKVAFSFRNHGGRADHLALGLNYRITK